MKAPTPMKTGTTIVGLVFKVRRFHIVFLPPQANQFICFAWRLLCVSRSQDGVVLGADTRATEGSIVCDKNCEKIHYIARNMYCCGAGTSADTENVTVRCWRPSRLSACQSMNAYSPIADMFFLSTFSRLLLFARVFRGT